MHAAERPRILQLAFNRFFLIHPKVDSLAWTGSTWARHHDGIPTGGAQICNFTTEAEATAYLRGPALVAGIGSPLRIEGK